MLGYCHLSMARYSKLLRNDCGDCLPDKVKKPKWAKPRKPHGKASARSFTGAEAAEIAADKAEKSSRCPESSAYMSLALRIVMARLWCLQRSRGLPARPNSPGSITLALRTSERLRLGPDLIPRVSPPRESEPAWQLRASTAPKYD